MAGISTSSTSVKALVAGGASNKIVPLNNVCLARATVYTFGKNTNAFKEEKEHKATKKRRKQTCIVQRFYYLEKIDF